MSCPYPCQNSLQSKLIGQQDWEALSPPFQQGKNIGQILLYTFLNKERPFHAYTPSETWAEQTKKKLNMSQQAVAETMLQTVSYCESWICLDIYPTCERHNHMTYSTRTSVWRNVSAWRPYSLIGNHLIPNPNMNVECWWWHVFKRRKFPIFDVTTIHP